MMSLRKCENYIKSCGTSLIPNDNPKNKTAGLLSSESGGFLL